MLKFCLLKLIWQIDITKIINLSAILWLFKHLHKRNIENIDDFVVTEKNLKDGIKLMFGENSKILVRPSGTEPLLRIYFETDSDVKLDKLKQAVQKILI